MNLSGRSLNQYRLIGELGAGGMGVVYRARDTLLGRDVAVKVLPPETLQSEEARGRFLREARAASALNHPNVVTIYEVGCVDGIDFIAMEYVQGQTLHALLHQRRLSVAEATGYALQVADALTKAHAAGVVHRDLKPRNLVIDQEGLVKVLDFGLARLHEAARAIVDDDAPTENAFATRAGVVMGTVAYMSPEQARGAEAGPQADIFSLGVVLFEMLSGQLPFDGSSDLARLHSLHVSPPKDLRAIAPDVPENLARIVGRMLEKTLASRYGSMAELRSDLRAVAGHPRSTTAPPALPPPPASVEKPRERAIESGGRRRRALTGALVVAALAGGGWWALTSRDQRSGEAAARSTADAFDPATATPYELYGRARSLLDRFDREGNPALAIPLLERAVEKDDGFALGYATLTEAYRYRFKEAPDEQWRKLMAQSAERALQLNPELAAAHVAMGLVRMEEPGRAAEAEAHFQRAIDLDPRNAAPHLWMVVLLSATRQTARATETISRVLEIDPGNWAALQELGLIRYRAADYSGATAAWERARAASPDNVRVLGNLAAAYHMADRYEDAASTLQRAIEIDPAARHYTNLGTLRFFQGRYEEAIGPLAKAVELAPNRYLYWGNLADAYRWSPGRRGLARAAYERALQLLGEQLAAKPGDADMRSTLALYRAKAGDTAEAREALDTFAQRPPVQAGQLFRLAVAYEIIGERELALGMLERALAAGYANKEVRGEPELVNLRNDLRYHRLVAQLPSSGSR